MSRRFAHLGREWEAFATGSGHGVGFGFPPPINRWGVTFRALTGDDRSDYRGSISKKDPESVSENELKRVLEEQLVLAAINRSKYVWRPAEAISRDLGLSLERVQQILEDSSTVVEGSRNPQGLCLYSTRDHLTKTASSAMNQFFEMEESS